MSDEVARYTCSMTILGERGRDFPWEIKVLPGLGRTCFATRTIEAGETLVYDEPLLYWEEETPIESVYSKQIIEACRKGGGVHNNVVNYLSAYASASTETKTRIADFMHVTTAKEAGYIAHMTRIWRRIADDIWSSFSDDRGTDLKHHLKSRDDVVALLTKSHLNAHTFDTGHVMLEIASKFNHSCSPNATYNKFVDSRTGKNLMRVFTIKRILAGEEIQSTYIGGLDMLKSTRDRREQLMLEKAFLCNCSRCTSPELLAPLPCPSCSGTSVRFDEDEWPWHCLHCHRRWWDAEITSRETQLNRLIVNLDRDMSSGRFPPLQIIQFVLRDTIQDLSTPHHHLVYRARTLLDELYAFRVVTHQLGDREHLAHRIANAWTCVDFLSRLVWAISPVVATNLAVLRVRNLLGQHGRFPPGVPKQPFKQMLVKTESFLRSFWGEDDTDAELFRKALYNERICQSCKAECVTLVVCGSCASTHYCSRTCQEREKSSHLEACQMGQEVGSILHKEVAF